VLRERFAPLRQVIVEDRRPRADGAFRQASWIGARIEIGTCSRMHQAHRIHAGPGAGRRIPPSASIKLMTRDHSALVSGMRTPHRTIPADCVRRRIAELVLLSIQLSARERCSLISLFAPPQLRLGLRGLQRRLAQCRCTRSPAATDCS